MRTMVDFGMKKALLNTAPNTRRSYMLNGWQQTTETLIKDANEYKKTPVPRYLLDIADSSGAPEGEDSCLRPGYDNVLTDFQRRMSLNDQNQRHT